ncbi:hypothetical protein [uncultured Muribaculum sp.]|uniref:hypothetical protein n=1 Tax=uncultured Muribaculum sp. TaxID=1918613 RepID=UPI002731899F|nr:hypothetical protein [uncultured Muribaculum sp.]
MTVAIILGFIIIIYIAAKKQKYDMTARLITGRMFQMLESFKIIDNTIKLDIFTQRLDFLCKLAKEIPPSDNLKHFADITLRNYTRKYPKIFITPTYRQIIERPQIVCSDKFRDEAATAFYMRACENLKENISTLKTTAAKQRRIKQAEEWAEMITDMLRSYDKPRYTETIRETCTSVRAMGSSHIP